MELYHFSEEPDIPRFEPRAPRARPEVEPLVWAIDAWHAPMYYFPRECPRACFWPGDKTTDDDRERWFGGIEADYTIATGVVAARHRVDDGVLRHAAPEHPRLERMGS